MASPACCVFFARFLSWQPCVWWIGGPISLVVVGTFCAPTAQLNDMAGLPRGDLRALISALLDPPRSPLPHLATSHALCKPVRAHRMPMCIVRLLFQEYTKAIDVWSVGQFKCLLLALPFVCFSFVSCGADESFLLPYVFFWIQVASSVRFSDARPCSLGVTTCIRSAAEYCFQ